MEDSESFKEKSFSDGELSIGKFKKRHLCGNRMYNWKDEIIYMGDFLYGKITGKGVMLWPLKTKNEDKFFDSCSHDNYRIFTRDDYIDKFVSKIFNDNKNYTGSDGIIYEGDWIDGKMTGKGVMIWPSGTKYEGEFFNNCRHGHGTFTKSNGDVYIGEFKNKFLHGNGKYIWSNGTIYEGNWVEGKMSGKGLITCPSGEKYEGEFYENCRHGNGIQTWKNENIYIGNWKRNKMDGKGIMKWANGDVFDGCWLNGLTNGYGVYRFVNGDVYIGNFKSNIRHGNGKYMWLSGKIYQGDWVDGKKTGKETKWPSQTKYETKSLKDGKGTLYYPYEGKKPSLLKKLCTILNYKNPKSKINPSFSEKAPLCDR